MRIKEVAELTGISTRTLRYYDEIGLLTPNKDNTSAYRDYSDEDLEKLQQILFYKELNYPLKTIQKIMRTDRLEVLASLKEQRRLLIEQQEQLKRVIELIDHTIHSKEENIPMTNEEKFRAFKENMIDKNEQQYGEELREKYGEEEIVASYGKLRDMTEEQYEAVRGLEESLIERLIELREEKVLDESIMLEVAELHKRWLSFYWEKYSLKAHFGLAQMYLADERFVQYYDEKAGVGATELLVKCITLYTKE